MSLLRRVSNFWTLILFLICALFAVNTYGDVVITDFQLVNLHEDTNVETDLATVFCVDNGTTPNQKCPLCRLSATRPTAGPFAVWKKYLNTDFHVYFVSNLFGLSIKFSTVSSYELDIECDSFVKPTTKALKTLRVDIQPNLPPAINNFPSAEVTRNVQNAVERAPGFTLYTLGVKDNESDPISYTLWTEPLVDLFEISANNGVIKNKRDLRYSVYSTINVKINVSDGSNVVGPFTLIVRLNNVNNRPQITNLPVNLTILETAVSGTTIITLTYTDSDQFIPLDPKCTVDPPAEDFKFIYEKNSRRLKLAVITQGTTLLDAESTSLYKICCVVNDGFLDSVGECINLSVLNVNEPPTFNQVQFSCTLTETTTSNAGSRCNIPLVVSEPENDPVTKLFLLPGNNSDRFIYDAVARQLGFEGTTYDVDQQALPTTALLTLAATDDKSATGTTKILVTILDANDNAPSFANNVGLNFQVTQGVTPIGSLGNVVATDNDRTSPNNQFTYALKQTVPSTSVVYFTVYGNGELRYVNAIPASQGEISYLLYVEVKDQGVPQLSSTGTVAISYLTTTTSTTTTSTTTTTTTTVATTTTTEYNFFSRPENVALFVVLMLILGALLIVGIALLVKYCCGAGGNGCFGSNQSNVRKVGTFEKKEYERFREGSRGGSPYDRRRDPRDHNRSYDGDRNFDRDRNFDKNRNFDRDRFGGRDGGNPYRDPGTRDPNYASPDYRGDNFWKNGDHYEDGRPWSTSLVRIGGLSAGGGSGLRPLPAAKPY